VLFSVSAFASMKELNLSYIYFLHSTAGSSLTHLKLIFPPLALFSWIVRNNNDTFCLYQYAFWSGLYVWRMDWFIWGVWVLCVCLPK